MHADNGARRFIGQFGQSWHPCITSASLPRAVSEAGPGDMEDAIPPLGSLLMVEGKNQEHNPEALRLLLHNVIKRRSSNIHIRIKTIDPRNACPFIRKRPDPWVSILTVSHSMSTPSHIPPQESAYIGNVLVTMGARVSAVLTAFSGWMLVGFAAILATLLANSDSLSTLLEPGTLSTIAKLFSAAVFFSLLQRYSSAIVAASAAGGKEVGEHPFPDGMNPAAFLQQLEQATLWPTRYFVRWSNKKILNGDLAFGGRLVSTFAQIEAWLVFFQLLTSMAAIWVLASGFRG